MNPCPYECHTLMGCRALGMNPLPLPLYPYTPISLYPYTPVPPYPYIPILYACIPIPYTPTSLPLYPYPYSYHDVRVMSIPKLAVGNSTLHPVSVVVVVSERQGDANAVLTKHQ